MRSLRLGLFSLRFWAGTVFVALVLCFLLGLFQSNRNAIGKQGDSNPVEPTRRLASANNPVQLIVLVEPGKLLGWVSGTESRKGVAALISTDGKPVEKIAIDQNNSFIWSYRVEKETPAQIWVGNMTRVVMLQPSLKQQSTAYFVLDRQIFRPGQPMHFVGFLRDCNQRGEFSPLAHREIEARLTSESKKTIVKKWELKSDELGKISGEYTFTDVDALDNYTLSIEGYRGSAQLGLAEYRKPTSQVRLKGSIDAGKLTVQFSATNVQGQPIAAERIKLTTQIVSKPRKNDSGELDSSEFAYAILPPSNQPNPELLNDDEQLLARFYSSPISGLPTTETAFWEKKAESKLDNTGKGSVTLNIPEKWRHGRYTAIVRAIMVDDAGREIQAFHAIPLEEAARSFRLQLAKSVYTENESIRIKAESAEKVGLKGNGSLVVFRLAPIPPPVKRPPNHPNNVNGLNGFPNGKVGFGSGTTSSNFSSGSNPNASAFNSIPSHPLPSSLTAIASMSVVPGSKVDRKFVTAASFQNDTAIVKLKEPGAYQFVAVWNTADGGKLQQEIGCIVRRYDQTPRFTLQLDKTTLEPGEFLTGTIRSQYSDAQVLMAVRDSSGYQQAKAVRLKQGRADIREPLPKNLKYGACVELLYLDRLNADDAPQCACQYVRVVPRDRIITIKTTHKADCEPGENVLLDLEVNRQEPVDLIVSVFDRSLSSIHDRLRTDIRDYYLADDRVRDLRTRDLLRRSLGNITVKQLIQRAQIVGRTLPHGSDDEQALARLTQNYMMRNLQVNDLVTLLRLAGLQARCFHQSREPRTIPKITWQNADPTLIDLLEGRYEGWSLQASMFFDMVILAESHPTIRPDAYAPLPQVIQGGGNGLMGMGAGIGGLQGNMMGMGGFGGMRGGMMGMGGGMMGMGGGMMGMGGGGVQGAPPQGAPHQAPVEAIKIPGGLDTGEMFIRRDFADLAYWNGSVRTNENGKARVEFKLPDSLTSWEVQVAAVSRQMHVGSTTSNINTNRPIMVSPVLPRFFVENDEVMVSGIVYNRSGTAQKIQVKLEAKNGKVLSPTELQVEVAEKGQATVSWKFKAGQTGVAQVLISAVSPAGNDASLKSLSVIQSGAPEVLTWSGRGKGQAVLDLPEGVKPEDARLDLTVSPSMTADLVNSLEYLVEYPYGCVEQTMSRFLPGIKVAQVLQRKNITNPRLAQKLPIYAAAGIKRLLELQHPDGGWGWNGNGATHEMMTPYALYGLIEAEKAGFTIPSETAMNMGFARLRRFIDTMTERHASDRIYCMSVYGLKYGLRDEWWAFIAQQAEKKELSDYALALSLEMAVRHANIRLAEKLVVQLRERAVVENGRASWRTAGFSHWGDDRFEITAAAMKALVAYDKDDPLIFQVIEFFIDTKRGNRWNSTKDTAMIVYAMCDFLDRIKDNAPDTSKVVLRVNDGEPIEIDVETAHESKTISIPKKLLREGKNLIRFEKSPAQSLIRACLRFSRSGGVSPPLSSGLRVVQRFFLLDGNGKKRVELHSGDAVPKGSHVLSVVSAISRNQEQMSYLLIESAVPAGAEVISPKDKRFNFESTSHVLREEREGKVAFHHESAPGTVEDSCVLHMEMAGEFLIPPSRAELMYQTQTFGHSGTFSLRVR